MIELGAKVQSRSVRVAAEGHMDASLDMELGFKKALVRQMWRTCPAKAFLRGFRASCA